MLQRGKSMGGTVIMGEKRLRTSQRKKRERAKFWDRHGEKIRLALIGGGVLAVSVVIANMALGGGG